VAKKTAIALLGPTASGKSRLDADCGAASVHAGRNVSIDSAQVTHGHRHAKPSPAERRAVLHHDRFARSDRTLFPGRRADAIRAAADIHGRAGSCSLAAMLYYRTPRWRIAGGKRGIRAQIDHEAATGMARTARGTGESDPQPPPASIRLMPSASSALEVCRLTGKPISELQRSSKIELPALRLSLVPKLPNCIDALPSA
jgi:hypothetical protein